MIKKSDLIKLAREISFLSGVHCDIDYMFGGYRFVKIVSEHGDMRDILQTGHTDRKRLYEYMLEYRDNLEENLESLRELSLTTGRVRIESLSNKNHEKR